MPRKHLTPDQKAQIITLRAAGYSVSTIADRIGVSVSTVKRHIHGITKGSANQELVDQAKIDLLASLSDDAIKLNLASLVLDDIALSHKIRESIVGTLEYIERQKPSNLQEASQVMRAATAAATALKATSDTLRQCLGVNQRQLHETTGGDLPELTIIDMTEEEMTTIRGRAEALSMGVDDGLGGILTHEDNGIVTEGLEEEPEAA